MIKTVKLLVVPKQFLLQTSLKLLRHKNVSTLGFMNILSLKRLIYAILWNVEKNGNQYFVKTLQWTYFWYTCHVGKYVPIHCADIFNIFILFWPFQYLYIRLLNVVLLLNIYWTKLKLNYLKLNTSMLKW